jgi:hypothetical protein
MRRRAWTARPWVAPRCRGSSGRGAARWLATAGMEAKRAPGAARRRVLVPSCEPSAHHRRCGSSARLRLGAAVQFPATNGGVGRDLTLKPSSRSCPLLFRVVRYLPVACHGRGHGADLRAGVGQAPREETAGHAAVVRLTLCVYGDLGRSRGAWLPMPVFGLPLGQRLMWTCARVLVRRQLPRVRLLRIQRWPTRCCPAGCAPSSAGI